MEKLNSFGKKKNAEEKRTHYRERLIYSTGVYDFTPDKYNGAKITPRGLLDSGLFDFYCTTSDRMDDLRKVLHLEDEKLLDGCDYYI